MSLHVGQVAGSVNRLVQYVSSPGSMVCSMQNSSFLPQHWRYGQWPHWVG